MATLYGRTMMSYLWLMPVFVIDMDVFKWFCLQYWLLFWEAEVTVNLNT